MLCFLFIFSKVCLWLAYLSLKLPAVYRIMSGACNTERAVIAAEDKDLLLNIMIKHVILIITIVIVVI